MGMFIYALNTTLSSTAFGLWDNRLKLIENELRPSVPESLANSFLRLSHKPKAVELKVVLSAYINMPIPHLLV